MLSELESVTERQERTRGLRAQYMRIRQKGGEKVDMEGVIAEMLGDGKFDSLRQAAPVLVVLQEAKRYEDMKSVIDSLRDKLPDSDLSKLDRVLADAYASSGAEKLQTEAISIYENLIASDHDDAADMKHNLATLLYNRDRDKDDGRPLDLWADAYAQRPADHNIRKAFAQCLLRHKRDSDAQKVLAGKPIEPT